MKNKLLYNEYNQVNLCYRLNVIQTEEKSVYMTVLYLGRKVYEAPVNLPHGVHKYGFFPYDVEKWKNTASYVIAKHMSEML